VIHKWTASFMMTVGIVILFLPRTISAQTQEPVPENDANCVACHEHQYYLYDQGKWFCLCEAPMHCVYCHSGRTDSSVKEIAHEGLVLYPTRDQATRCQTCHSEDYMSRVVTFANVAGLSSTPVPIITATAIEQTAIRDVDQPNPLLLRLRQLEPWRLYGLGLITIVFFGIVIIGYRCWKADCLAQSNR
jgi:hypothetical protein